MGGLCCETRHRLGGRGAASGSRARRGCDGQSLVDGLDSPDEWSVDDSVSLGSSDPDVDVLDGGMVAVQVGLLGEPVSEGGVVGEPVCVGSDEPGCDGPGCEEPGALVRVGLPECPEPPGRVVFVAVLVLPSGAVRVVIVEVDPSGCLCTATTTFAPSCAFRVVTVTGCPSRACRFAVESGRPFPPS